MNNHFEAGRGSLCSAARRSTISLGSPCSSSRNAALVQPKPTTFIWYPNSTCASDERAATLYFPRKSSVVMRGRAERSEAEANVETGLAHRAVALVIVRTEFELARLLASRRRHSGWNITDLQRIRRPCQGLSRSRRNFENVVVSLSGMKKEVGRNLPIKAALVLQSLRWRPLAKVEVAR